MSAFSWRRLAALCRKESFQIVRDPSSVLIAFILPVLLLFIFGFGVSLDASRMRIGIVSESPSAEAQAFADALYGSPFIEAVHGHSRVEMIEWLRAGRVRGVVVLAPDFARRLVAGRTAPVELLTDGAEPNTAHFVASYVQGVWQVWQQQRAEARGQHAAPMIELVPRYWFNPSTVSRNYLVPGSIAVIMTIIGALLTSLVVAREWERGTMEALLSTPVSKTELLLSKILPYFLLGLLSMLICLAVTVWVLAVPFNGSLWVLLLVTSLFLGSALGLGLLISTLTRNQFNAAQAALNAAFLPATMLSGFAFEIASMPAPVRAVTYLIPARYFVSALQTLFQAGQVWPVLWRQMAFLLVSALFWLGLTAWKTARRLD
ncbi:MULTISPECIES: ABC transporter permease [unclassified Paludibacterium]|uniref:ABC transporter permease n=1 Tax=unclassified Paludibacterium TaxID=2618429 RepID=UPI001C056047|nr:ABC transporter permease [Paludibacterium sp. B53371]BEV70927.1 ABC transporter permease [Paludibacterium sp. THUN1379]